MFILESEVSTVLVRSNIQCNLFPALRNAYDGLMKKKIKQINII